jgi:hypothetical protein
MYIVISLFCSEGRLDYTFRADCFLWGKQLANNIVLRDTQSGNVRGKILAGMDVAAAWILPTVEPVFNTQEQKIGYRDTHDSQKMFWQRGERSFPQIEHGLAVLWFEPCCESSPVGTQCSRRRRRV